MEKIIASGDCNTLNFSSLGVTESKETLSPPLNARVAELANPILSPGAQKASTPLIGRDLEKLKTSIVDTELRAISAFASEKSVELTNHKYFSKKEMRAISSDVSYAVTVYPGGEFIIHLGKKGDPLFNPKERGTWKVLTRGIGVSKSHVQALAVLQAEVLKAGCKEEAKLLAEDERGTKYNSDYVIKPSAKAIVHEKEDKAKVYLFQSLADMDGQQFLRSKPSVEARIKVVHDVARGLEAIHQAGDLHRDVKLANILIDWTADNRGVRGARLADLGFCIPAETLQNAWDSKEPLPVSGTEGYVPPEVMQGHRQQRSSDDIYALGIVLFKVLEDCEEDLTEEQLSVCGDLMQEMLQIDELGTLRPSAKNIAEKFERLL